MKRQRVAKAAAPAQSRNNSLQRHGQTVTVLFGGKRPGPSVKMLFEEADLDAFNKIEEGDNSR